MFCQCFQNGAHIADRHFFVEQILQYFVQRRQSHYARHQIFGQLRHLLRHAIQQLLRFLATKQFRRELTNQVVEMRRDHGAGFNNRVTLNLRLLFQGAFNPDCGQTKGRVDRLLAWQRTRRRAWVNRQPASRVGIAAANLHAFHQNAIACRWQVHVVADVNHRRQEAHILSEFFTDTANAPEQFAVLLEIDHRYQTITHFHSEGIFQLDIIPRGFNRLIIVRHFNRRRLCDRFGIASAQPPGQTEQCSGKQQEDEVWHARHQTQQAKHRRRQHQHVWIGEQLADHLLANVFVGTHAGHNNARCGRDNEGWDLRHQAVTDSQQRIAFRRMAHVHAVLENTHQQAADNVDNHDQDTGDGIAANELTRTVHRTVEISFLGHVGAAFFRFIFANQPGIQIGVNGHLFARHPVQHETCANFGDTARTFGDNHKVDDNEDHEHHDTDSKVTANEEVTKGLNHFTRRRPAGMSVHQNDTRGRDVQRQAQQRREQQDGRECSKIKGSLGKHRHQQHHDG
ncbi:hypothetical protein D3C72_856630 [compost metagenome]